MVDFFELSIFLEVWHLVRQAWPGSMDGLFELTLLVIRNRDLFFVLGVAVLLHLRHICLEPLHLPEKLVFVEQSLDLRVIFNWLLLHNLGERNLFFFFFSLLVLRVFPLPKHAG